MLVQSLCKADLRGLEQRMKQIELNIRGNVVSVSRYVRNLCKRCTTSISPSLKTTRGTRYVDFSFFRAQIFDSVHSAFSGFRFDFRSIPDSASKNVKAMVSMILRQQAVRFPCVPSGGPWCVSFEVSITFMDTCHTPRSPSDAKFSQERTPHHTRLLNLCKRRTEFNKNN